MAIYYTSLGGIRSHILGCDSEFVPHHVLSADHESRPPFACHWRCYTASQRRIDFERDGNGIGKEVDDAVHEFFCCLCLFPLQHGIRNFAKKRSDLAPVALYIDSQHRSACTTLHLPFFGVSFWLSSTRRSLTATNRVPIIVAKASRHRLHCALRLEIIKTRVTTHHCCLNPSSHGFIECCALLWCVPITGLRMLLFKYRML